MKYIILDSVQDIELNRCDSFEEAMSWMEGYDPYMEIEMKLIPYEYSPITKLEEAAHFCNSIEQEIWITNLTVTFGYTLEEAMHELGIFPKCEQHETGLLMER